MRRPLRHLFGPVLLVVTLAGCGASSDRALNLTLSALGTPTPKAPSPPTTPKVPSCNRTASLRPPATVPAPNHMPAGSFMAKIQKQGYLVAGVNEGAYRFGALNPATGNIEGFEVDLVNELAKAIFGDAKGRHVRLVALTVPQRFSAAQRGTVDIVADTITITCYRRTLVDFTTVYYDGTQRLMVPSGSGVKSIQALAHKRVCASKGSVPIDVMKGMQPADRRPVPIGMDQAIDCLVALQQGQGNLAGISTDSGILLGFKAQDPNTEIVGTSLGDVPYGMAISKAHPDFVRFVNGVLAKLKSDGTWQRLYAKRLGDLTPGSTPAPPNAQYDG
jgi:polar amino acid transport system substrate-binding protein